MAAATGMSMGVLQKIKSVTNCRSKITLVIQEELGNMKMKKALIILCILAASMLLSGFKLAGDSEASNEFIRMNAGVTAKMMDADYWIEKSENSDEVVMTAKEIAKWNKKHPNTVTVGDKSLSIIKMTSTVDGETVRSLIECLGAPSAGTAYIDGKPITQEYIDKLYELRNLDAIPEKISVGYGFSTSRQSLRSMPTNDFAGEDKNDYFYDTLVTSEYMPFLPLRVLHESSDGNWYFVMFSGYAGWVEKKYVALCDSRKEWLERQKIENFLVVTGRELRLPDDVGNEAVSGLILPMGTKMELVKPTDAPSNIRGRVSYANYIVKIPTAGSDGKIKDEYVLVPVSEDVHVGYVTYTHGNVVRLAMELLGDRYGWAGLSHSNDCSGVVREIFSCFGFDLPRGAGTQAYMQNMTTFAFDENSTDEEKLEVLKNAPVGSLVYFRGHIMIYLGMVKNQPYVISSLGSFVAKPGGKIISCNTMMINNMMRTYRGNGNSWLTNVSKVLYCEPNNT